MEKIKDIYRKYTKIPKKEMDNILKHDIWWEAENCIRRYYRVTFINYYSELKSCKEVKY